MKNDPAANLEAMGVAMSVLERVLAKVEDDHRAWAARMRVLANRMCRMGRVDPEEVLRITEGDSNGRS